MADQVSIKIENIIRDINGMAPEEIAAVFEKKTDNVVSLSTKVDKITGKSLSANDFTNTYKAKLESNTLAGHGITDALTRNETFALITTGTVAVSPSTPGPFNIHVVYAPDTLDVAYPNFGGLTPTKNFPRFIYNGTAWTLQDRDIDTTGLALSSSLKTVDEKLYQKTSYQIDFSTLTFNGEINIRFANNVPFIKSQPLYLIRVYANIGTTVSPFAYNVINTDGVLSYNLLHTYATFVTTSSIHTEIITDRFVIPAGAFLFFSQDTPIKFVYTSDGTPSGFRTDFTTTTPVTVGIDFITADFGDNVGNDVAVLKSNLSAVSNTLGETIKRIYNKITKYPVDFTPLTSKGGILSGIYFANNIPVIEAGVLPLVHGKADVGTTVSIFAYKVINNSGVYTFIQLHAYEPFVTTEFEYTKEISDSFLVPVGSHIFCGQDTGFYFTFNDQEAFRSDITTRKENLTIAMDYVIASPNDTVADVVLKPVTLYKNNLTSLSDFTAVGWSLNSPGAVPTGTGASNYLWLQRRFQVHTRQLDIELTLSSNSIFEIWCAPILDAIHNGFYQIDMVHNKLGVYNAQATLVVEGVVSFSLVSGRKYVVSLSVDDLITQKFTITDTITGDSYTLDYTMTGTFNVDDPTQIESYKFYLNSGTTSGVKLHSVNVSSKKNPLVYLSGDSITEGLFIPFASWNSRYAMLLKKALKGDMVTSARGGATVTDVLSKLDTEAAFIKPDYVMTTIGTNAGLTTQNLTDIKAKCDTIGTTLIVNHIPCAADNRNIAVNNTIDAFVLANPTVILGAKLDVATAVNNDPAQGYNSALYHDPLHPNVDGNDAMFKRFKIDLPFLFA